MTAKEFLRRARDADRRYGEAVERAARVREKLEAGRMSSGSGMPRGGKFDWTDAADRLIELERRVHVQAGEWARLKQAALDAIEAVPEPRLREVLELYYVDGLTWDGVARKLGKDTRWVFRLHGQALLRVKVPETKEENENAGNH